MKYLSFYRYSFILISLTWMSLLFNSCAKQSLNNEKKKSAVSKLLAKAKNSSSHEKAIRYLEQAIDLDSLSSESRIALAEQYESMNFDWKAEMVLQNGYLAGIREPALLYHLGRIQIELNKFSEAAAHLEQVPIADSLYPASVYLLAQSRLRQNDFLSAKKWLDTLNRFDYWKNKPAVLSMNRRLSEAGVITGIGSGTPVEAIARSETATRYHLAVLADHFLTDTLRSALTVVFEDISVSDAIYPVCAAAVQNNFLESLPDGKFHPHRRVKKRNLAFYLHNWLKAGGFNFNGLTASAKTWKDLNSSDPHYALFIAAEKSGIINAAGDSLFGGDNPVTGKEAVMAFERAKQLITTRK